MEYKWLIRGSLAFSILINIGHGWEYQAAEDTVANQQVYTDIAYRNINGASYSDYPKANQETPYFVYSIVYFLINFGVFFILNTGIEVKIVRRMHKELKEKRERHAKMKATNLSKKMFLKIFFGFMKQIINICCKKLCNYIVWLLA
jgi:hypothetical protein